MSTHAIIKGIEASRAQRQKPGAKPGENGHANRHGLVTKSEIFNARCTRSQLTRYKALQAEMKAEAKQAKEAAL